MSCPTRPGTRARCNRGPGRYRPSSMRALLIAGAAAAALAGLTGCGQDDGAAAGPEQARTTEPPSTLATKVPPEPTGITPTPPNTKPQDPSSGPARPPGTTPSAPVSMSPTGPVVPPGVRQVPSAQIDASAVPEYYEHRGLVWVYDDGHSLQMFAAASSGCGGVEAQVSESAGEVRIDMRPMPQPQGGPPDGEMCTTVITPRPVTVALDAPLGDRMIYLSGGR